MFDLSVLDFNHMEIVDIRLFPHQYLRLHHRIHHLNTG